MGIVSTGRLLAAALSCLVFSAFASAQGAPASPSKTGEISVGDFARTQEFSQVTISPNGKLLAALAPMADNPQENVLVILDSQTAKVLHVIHSGHHAMINAYMWANNDRLVGSVAVVFMGLANPLPTGELFAVSADGTHQMNLFGPHAGANPIRHTDRHGNAFGGNTFEERDAAANIIGRLPQNDDQILITSNNFTNDSEGNFTYAQKLDVNNARTADIGKAPDYGKSPARNASMVADHAGQVRAAYADNEYNGHTLWLRVDNDAPWTLVNEPTKSHSDIVPIGFNRDNSKLYVRVTQGSKPNAIELMDVASKQLTMVFEGKFANPGELLPTADDQDYYAIITYDGQRAIHYIDDKAPEANLTKALSANFPGQLVVFSSFSRDGKHAIAQVSSDRDAGDYYLFDLDSHNARYLVSAASWIDPRRMHPMQPIELNARDGLALHGFLTLPSGEKPFPLVILPHDDPHETADTWHFNEEVQLLASRGYAVLQVNYRGSNGYGTRFRTQGFQQWGLGMQDDLADATRWAVEQGYTDSKRICIYGSGYGGYAALEGAVREPGLYKCAIGNSGYYDLRELLDRHDLFGARRIQGTDKMDAALHTVLGNDRDSLLGRSPLNGADRITSNILLVHGEDAVTYDSFKALTKALDKYGKHYETLVEPNEFNGFFLPEHRQEAYQKMLDFLDRNIGPGSVGSH
jgi:dipeptidyl aminopeptidase/acylaminoacyl peptidase